MDNFIAIDVETANYSRSSICSIVAVKVRDGLIVDSRYSLVCPEPDYYCQACVRVHGITADDTWNAPSFGQVWSDWLDWLEDLPLVAHNASFDSACITSACRIYQLDPPPAFLCTLAAARRAIPRGVLQSKSLDSLCDYFGIPLRNHHNALDDATACARLAMVLL
ncbi:MAG: 3'-5' exonuclease [Muribaculaceae bacterium]|nr:3'-5' exonuclease [Muribaculaceae bacterium]MDE6135134.1 3'-5' exonuclease [Muribaculaceae bacterium]